jgi:hypothetical protein
MARIFAVAEVTDGGGNKVKGNAVAEGDGQCEGVMCS